MKFFIFAFLGLTTISCTREASETISVNFSMGPGSQSAAIPKVMIINVSGPGFETLYYSWESCNDDNAAACPPGSLTPPTQVQFEVPKGTNRLFQAIAAYENNDYSIEFQYGDVNKTISSAQETVSINLAPIGASGTKFDFAGRYSKTTLQKPSGVVKTMYRPPGKPAMLIEKSFIFNGWFSLFGVDNASFSYVIIPQGGGGEVPLFANMNLDTDSFPVSDKILRINVPLHARIRDLNNNTTVEAGEFEYSGQAQFILGFFTDSGYSGGTEKACYPAAVSLPRLLDIEAVDLDDLPNCAAPSTPCGIAGESYNLNWNIGTTNSSAGLNRTVNGYGNACSVMPSSHEYSQLMFVPQNLVNGEDGLKAMRGPFALTEVSGQYHYVDLVKTTTTMDVKFTYLPGITVGVNSVFDGSHIFYKVNGTSPFNRDTDKLDCRTLIAEGFSGPLNYTAVGGSPESLTIPGLTFTTNQYRQAVICPYKTVGGVVKYLPNSAIAASQINP